MNSTLNYDPELAARFVLTLAHFLWQGAAIGLVVLAAGVVLKRASARLRYGVYLAALIVMALCVPVTYMALGAGGNYGKYGSYGTGEIGPASRAGVAGQITPAGAASQPSAIDPVTPSTPSTSSTPSDSHSLAQASVPTSALAPALAPTAATAQAAATWRAYTPHLVLAYIAGVLLMLARLALGLAGGGRLRKRAERITDSAFLKVLQHHAAQLKLRAIPVIAYCQRIAVPTVVGVIRPMVLLPASLASGMPPQQIELLLLHELAHIRRYDHIVNIAQRLIEAALFFHPAVWYVSHRIRVEREHCCDDLVIVLGGERYAYAESLVAAAALATGMRLSPAALAATGKPSQLRRRIHRLLGDPQPPVRLVRGGWVLAVLAIAAVIAGASQVANINGDEPEREMLAQAESPTVPSEAKPVTPPPVKPEPKPEQPKPTAPPLAEKPATTTDQESVSPAPETKELQDKYNELSTQMADPDWWLRKVAVQQLGELPYHPHFVFSLLPARQDAAPRVQAAAADGLAKQGDPDAIKHLVAALKGKSEVCEAAAEALTHFKPEQVMPLLTLAAQDEDSQVCGGAVTALGKQNTPEAAAVLVSLLPKYYGEQGGPVAPVARVRPGVSRGRSGIALGPVGKLLASAFGDMAPDMAMASLDRASKEGDWKSRTQIALLLDASGLRSIPSAQSLLTAFLADEQKDVRAAAAQVLGNALSESVEKGTVPPSELV
ncbi:MAG: HEAT repeat domain-containing protein, partial [Candidatus Hydrogenedentes bacterium]|nr:HEAT repeat domain-containing protein [Candidatus Hydrogenedentota bacterium]